MEIITPSPQPTSSIWTRLGRNPTNVVELSSSPEKSFENPNEESQTPVESKSPELTGSTEVLSLNEEKDEEEAKPSVLKPTFLWRSRSEAKQKAETAWDEMKAENESLRQQVKKLQQTIKTLEVKRTLESLEDSLLNTSNDLAGLDECSAESHRRRWSHDEPECTIQHVNETTNEKEQATKDKETQTTADTDNGMEKDLPDPSDLSKQLVENQKTVESLQHELQEAHQVIHDLRRQLNVVFDEDRLLRKQSQNLAIFEDSEKPKVEPEQKARGIKSWWTSKKVPEESKPFRTDNDGELNLHECIANEK